MQKLATATSISAEVTIPETWNLCLMSITSSLYGEFPDVSQSVFGSTPSDDRSPKGADPKLQAESLKSDWDQFAGASE